MRVHHQIDFTLEIFDSLTGGVLKGGQGLFHLNGLPLRPGKVVGSYMIFSNVFNDPKKIHLKSAPESHQLIWRHPLYAPIELKLVPTEMTAPDKAIVVVAKPSPSYPLPSGITGLRGKCLEGDIIRTTHVYNANRFHLKEAPKDDGTLQLSQSLEQRLDGKLLRVTSGASEQVTLRIGGTQECWCIDSLLEGATTSIHADADIFELLEVPIQEQGEFLLLLPNIRTEDSTLSMSLEIVNLQGVVLKTVDVTAEKGKLTSIERL